MAQFCVLEDRAVLQVAGEDSKTFLQGLISNDTNKVSPTQAIWAAFLTPQGKYLFDFSLSEVADALMIDTEAGRAADLVKRLTMFKLRSKATVAIADDWAVAVAFGEGAQAAMGLSDVPETAVEFAGGVAFTDPRLAAAGVRVVAPKSTIKAALADMGLNESEAAAYDAHRLSLGLPDGTKDMIVDKSILLESGFDELNGVDWDKGCYMGQELTARTKYRGLIKKRLVPVEINGPLPEPGTLVMTPDGKEAGEVRSGQGSRALALLRLERMVGAAPLTAGDATVTPVLPNWIKLPEPT